MDLVSWSLNATDQIFSMRRQSKGELSSSSGILAVGNVMDSWNMWRIVRLSILSIRDVEDAYVIRFLTTGFLLFGVSGYLVY